jgi:hypothetical protein
MALERELPGSTKERLFVETSVIVNLYRLKETQDHFLVGWVFTPEELRSLGFPPLEEFIGGQEKWNLFEIVRHQYAGHSTSRKATSTQPGRILSASVLGNALRETGLWDFEAFFKRVLAELVPGVERVRDELVRRYPSAEKFVKETYPDELGKTVSTKGDG